MGKCIINDDDIDVIIDTLIKESVRHDIDFDYILEMLGRSLYGNIIDGNKSIEDRYKYYKDLLNKTN